MPMIEIRACLACCSNFQWNSAKESRAARLICPEHWEEMRRYYQKHGFVIKTGQLYHDDHVLNYLTHLEAMRLKNVRSESGR